MTRAGRHALLAAASGVITGAAALAGPAAGAVDRASVATAWLCVALYCGVLSIGPRRVLAGKAVALNQLPRRDLGIWTAIVALAHFVLGNVEAMNQPYVQAVIASPAPPSAEIRNALFNWGASLGTLLALVFLILLLLSSNAALRWLGNRWWKRLQRLSYFGFALTVLHGLMFQVLEERASLWVALLVLAALAVISIQLAGRRRHQQQPSQTGRVN